MGGGDRRGARGLAERRVDARRRAVDRARGGRSVHPSRRGERAAAAPGGDPSGAARRVLARLRGEPGALAAGGSGGAGGAGRARPEGRVHLELRALRDPGAAHRSAQRGSQAARRDRRARRRREVQAGRDPDRRQGPGAAYRAEFEKLDGAVRAEGTTRPIYLRRGSYFDALCGLWHDLGATATRSPRRSCAATSGTSISRCPGRSALRSTWFAARRRSIHTLTSSPSSRRRRMPATTCAAWSTTSIDFGRGSRTRSHGIASTATGEVMPPSRAGRRQNGGTSLELIQPVPFNGQSDSVPPR